MRRRGSAPDVTVWSVKGGRSRGKKLEGQSVMVMSAHGVWSAYITHDASSVSIVIPQNSVTLCPSQKYGRCATVFVGQFFSIPCRRYSRRLPRKALDIPPKVGLFFEPKLMQQAERQEPGRAIRQLGILFIVRDPQGGRSMREDARLWNAAY